MGDFSLYQHRSHYTMLFLLMTLLSYQTVLSLETNPETNPKAASFRVNCGCQCSDLTFRDKYNRVQGNCKTTDNTGAQWCYTEQGSTCEDQQTSTRFQRTGKTWSYQACSTPSLNSPQCAGYSGGGFGGGHGEIICKNGRCGGNSGGFVGNNGGNTGGYGGNTGGFGGTNGGFGANNGGNFGGSSGSFGGNNGGFSGNNGGFSGNNGGHLSGNNGGLGSSSGGHFSGTNGGFGGNNGGFSSNNGGFGGSTGGHGSSGSIANCRQGQNCNVGNNVGSSAGQFNPYNSGSSGGSSSGYSGSLSSILGGRKTSSKDSVKFGDK